MKSTTGRGKSIKDFTHKVSDMIQYGYVAYIEVFGYYLCCIFSDQILS